MHDMPAPVSWNEQGEQLVIDWSSLLGHPCKLKVNAWSQGLNTIAVSDDEVVTSRLSEVGEWLFYLDDPAISRWRASIPPTVLTSLQQLPDNRAIAAELAVYSIGAKELLESNPTLMWLLIDRGLLNPEGNHHVLLPPGMKQRHLLAQLGLQGTKQQVRIVRKTRDSGLTKGEVNGLLDLLNNPITCNYLSHLHEVKSHQIVLLASYPWLAGCPAKALIPFLENRQLLRCFADTVRMLDELEPLKRCKVPLQLTRLHDRLVESLNNRRLQDALIRDEEGRIVPLPQPPVPGNEHVSPLTTQQAILSEGVVMRHCIGSYLQRVVNGGYAVYQMEQPERLTIGISIRADGSVLLDDIRGYRNAMPSDESLAIAQTWWADYANAS